MWAQFEAGRANRLTTAANHLMRDSVTITRADGDTVDIMTGLPETITVYQGIGRVTTNALTGREDEDGISRHTATAHSLSIPIDAPAMREGDLVTVVRDTGVLRLTVTELAFSTISVCQRAIVEIRGDQ